MRINLEQAVSRLKGGRVIAVPTETVYGLAASLEQEEAIQQIFLLKGRPATNPLIIHLAETHQLNAYVSNFPPGFQELANAFWPGPLTMILSVHPTSISSTVRAGLPTAGFRLPRHPLALQLLRQTGPLVMPSANLSGKPSATQVEHVEEDFGMGFPVLDGGSCQKGLESTILSYTKGKWVLLRLGSLPAESFISILGYLPEIVEVKGEAPLCPGQLFRHYAPKAKLLLDPEKKEYASFILGFKERSYPQDKKIIYLGSLTHPEEVAEHLYGALRQLDQERALAAWVDMDFPDEGLWVTIDERLRRASQGTP
jgi:L-threonylcarbamoyladenylate synthase